jgi:hypothetical protein
MEPTGVRLLRRKIGGVPKKLKPAAALIKAWIYQYMSTKDKSVSWDSPFIMRPTHICAYSSLMERISD